MKKIFLLSVLLFQLTFVFGQVKTENKKGYGMATGDYKPNRQETPTQNNNINKNDRSYQNSCYTGFAFTVKNYGYNKDRNDYSWGIKVKNNYTKAVSLRYKLIVGNDNTSTWATHGTLTYNIKPGESYTNDYGTMMGLIVNSNSDQYRIEISDVCFEGQDCIKNGYADCNGKQSKNTNDKSTSTNSNNNSTNQTNNSNQQNDLTEYNRSKADLERQLAEKNAEITRQNEENARLGQVWNNAIKAGVDAHNKGNYTEAKNQFTIAINNSSNETNRQNAQNYYDKANEKSKSNENFKKTSEVTLQTLGLIDNLLEANKNAKKINSQQMKSNPLKVLDALSYDVLTTFENAGFKFKKLSLEKIDEQQDYSYRMLIFENFQITLSTSEYVREVTIESIQLIKDGRNTDNNELGFKNVFEEILKKEPYKKYNNKKNKIEIIKEPFSKIVIQIFNLDFTKLTKNYNNEFDKYKNYNLSNKNENSFTINIEYQPTEDEINENEKFQKKKYNAEIEKYKALANKGDEDAIYEIAGLFRHMTEDLEWDDIDKNYLLAKYWYLKYAEKVKSGTAEYQIGILYLNGDANFPKDELLAKKWLTKSCNLGAKFACDKLEKLK